MMAVEEARRAAYHRLERATSAFAAHRRKHPGGWWCPIELPHMIGDLLVEEVLCARKEVARAEVAAMLATRKEVT